MSNYQIIHLEEDIPLLCMTANSFPEGVESVHKLVQSSIPQEKSDIKPRKVFGLSRPENGIGLIYKACIEEFESDDFDVDNFEEMIISEGNYYYTDLINYYNDIPKIGIVFNEMIQLENIDPNGYCIEWYMNEGKDMRCLVKIKD